MFYSCTVIILLLYCTMPTRLVNDPHRSKLPDTTPAFDILFHRRTPMEREINHLVVQCGKNHVHPLSQALLTTLDGFCAGVYGPQFAFVSMSTEKARKLFENHDSYIKALLFIPLSLAIPLSIHSSLYPFLSLAIYLSSHSSL